MPAEDQGMDQGMDQEFALIVLQGGKPVVPGKWTPVPGEGIPADSEGWLDLDGELDIGEFDSGVYELQVSVKKAGSDQVVQRGVAFGID